MTGSEKHPPSIGMGPLQLWSCTHTFKMQILYLSDRNNDSNKLKSACFKPTNGVSDNKSVNMAIVNGFYSDLLHFSSLDLWLIELASIAH